MIKELKKYQINLTPFQAIKNWDLDNIYNDDVLLLEQTSSEDGSDVALGLEFYDYGDGASYPITGSDYCNIALEKQEFDKLYYKEGENIKGTFYPNLDPVNKDGTYKRSIYHQYKTLFYNDYRNPSKLWGIEHIDFELSKTKRYLSDKIKIFEVSSDVYGDRIIPKSIHMINRDLNDDYTVIDDGYGNLIASKNLFSRYQEVGNFQNYISLGKDFVCDSYWNPTGSPEPVIPTIVLTVSSGSAILDWVTNFTDEDYFSIERSLNGIDFSEINTVSSGVYSYEDTLVTSSVEGTTYWYRVSSITSTSTSSISNVANITFTSPPEPGPIPSAPIFLEVFSGSAILIWDSGSNDYVDYWTVEKSSNGRNGPYIEIGTTPGPVLTYRDEDVEKNRTYWYRVAAINSSGTSSYSNLASIDIQNCKVPEFSPILYHGYINYSSGSVYRNIYGVIFPFSTSVEQSISVWGRSTDFDVYLTLADSNGNILIENDMDGWSPSGDVTNGNAAFTYTLSSGSYYIELSSKNNAIGRYILYISPGPKLETSWSNASETSTCEYIPSSNCVVVGENGYNIVWYNINTQTRNVINYPAGVQGICYSPHQDRVFAWVFKGDWMVGYTASIDEFDNLGNYVGSTEYPRPLEVYSAGSTLSQTGYTITLHPGGAINDFTTDAASGSLIYFINQGTEGRITSIIDSTTATVDISQEIPFDFSMFEFGTEFYISNPQITPNVDYSGYLTYDPRHDRIAFYKYSYATNHIFNIFDIPTRQITASLNVAPYTNYSNMWQGCYSWVDDNFYIALTDYNPLLKVNASNFYFTASSTNIKSKTISNYASSSGLLVLKNNSGKVVFADPISESVVYVRSDLPSAGLFEGAGRSGDPNDICVNSYVLPIDPNNGPNYPALALLDKNTYKPTNYLTINSDVPSGFYPDGWYQYSIAFAQSSSRMYSAQVSYDNSEGRLYSIKLSRIREPLLMAPYTSSAADTASCLTFKTEFPVSQSLASKVAAEYICSTKYTSSVNTLVVSDLELNESSTEQHNFNNCFISSNGTFLGNYTQSYTHLYSGHNAVFCNGKFYMLDDGLISQNVSTLEPIDSVNMLVFDQSGSLLSTIPLTYKARDWGADDRYIYVYEYTGSRCFVEIIDSNSDTIDSTPELIVGYTYSPTFQFFYASASISSSTNATEISKHYPYFGKIIVIVDSSGDTNIYYNNIYGPRVGTDPAPYNFLDTGSGDRIWAAGDSGYALYNYPTKLDMSSFPYKKWLGSSTYCPVTNTIFWGALNYNDDPVLIETNLLLSISTTHSLSYPANQLVWNKKHRTIEIYDNSENDGKMIVFDPIAKTQVCVITTLNNSIYGGEMGSNIDVDLNAGEVYVAQRYDDSTITGSIQVYKR